jgi:hypothetical protein
MHDPNTLAFSIPNPISWYRSGFDNKIRFNSLIDVWHIDPQKGGRDDSCGYSYVKLNKKQMEWCRKESNSEYDFIFGRYGKVRTTFGVIYYIWTSIAWKKDRKKNISFREYDEITSLAYNINDNLEHSVNILNSNVGLVNYDEVERLSRLYWEKNENEHIRIEDYLFNEDDLNTIKRGKDELYTLYCCIYRCYLTFHRPWYKQPKFHIHHWKIRVPLVLKIKRYLFSRCCRCHNMFEWKHITNVVSNQWDSDGPGWFKGEKGLICRKCYGKESNLKGT